MVSTAGRSVAEETPSRVAGWAADGGPEQPLSAVLLRLLLPLLVSAELLSEVR